MAEAGDRRLVVARDLGIMRRGAEWLVRRRAALNRISLAGVAAALLAGASLTAARRLHGISGALRR